MIVLSMYIVHKYNKSAAAPAIAYMHEIRFPIAATRYTLFQFCSKILKKTGAKKMSQ